MADLRRDSGGIYWAEQDKDSNLDYHLDWSDWLVPGDAIVSSTWTAPEGMLLTDAAIDGVWTSVFISGGTAGDWNTIVNRVVSQHGREDERTIRLYVNDQVVTAGGTVLFPDRRAAVAEFRRDRLYMASQALLPDLRLTDDYVFGKLRSAEFDAERRLRVFFSPVTIFAYEPTQAEIDAIGDGRWEEESPYDYEPSLWGVEDWAYTVLRKAPVIRVEMMKLAYPAPTMGLYNVPVDWIRLDKKAGHLRIVPTGSAISAGPLANFVMSTFGGGRHIPAMMQFRYVAGLQNVARDYPDLLDLVKKMAVLRVIQDAFLPSSGSISGDGLSESLSVQVESYDDRVDDMLNTLSQSIRGPRMIVL